MVQQFKKKDHEDIKISLPEEERIKLYNDKLKAEYNGPLYNTIASLFKYVIGVNVIVPSGIYTKYNNTFSTNFHFYKCLW